MMIKPQQRRARDFEVIYELARRGARLPQVVEMTSLSKAIVKETFREALGDEDYEERQKGGRPERMSTWAANPGKNLANDIAVVYKIFDSLIGGKSRYTIVGVARGEAVVTAAELIKGMFPDTELNASRIIELVAVFLGEDEEFEVARVNYSNKRFFWHQHKEVSLSSYEFPK